jgi:hypothetical protein
MDIQESINNEIMFNPAFKLLKTDLVKSDIEKDCSFYKDIVIDIWNDKFLTAKERWNFFRGAYLFNHDDDITNDLCFLMQVSAKLYIMGLYK